ncbi:hypothetical protein N1851_008004 [Merluccius polli]|uniref:Uncharacterized protein n=1 Tax=Merluccius polli TaxID=89951 RepID=A0AA47N229_MERPO|nr:hypothetical protein N1851_008004 [Merluccius polli]
MEELVEELHSTVKEDVVKLLPDVEGMRATFDEYFDKPVEVALGVRYDTRRNRATGTYEQIPVTDKFVYIPLLETLKFIFKEICDHILQHCEKTGVYVMVTILKITPFSLKNQTLSKYRYSTTFLANPLGSKHGIHKIGSI